MSHSEVNVDNTTDLNIIQKSEEKFKLNKNSELINDDVMEINIFFKKLTFNLLFQLGLFAKRARK